MVNKQLTKKMLRKHRVVEKKTPIGLMGKEPLLLPNYSGIRKQYGISDRIARWLPGGKLQDSGVTINDDGNILGDGVFKIYNGAGLNSYLHLGTTVNLVSAGNMQFNLGDDIGIRAFTITNASGASKFYMDSIGQFRFYNQMSYWGTSPFNFYMGRGAGRDAYLYANDNQPQYLFFEGGVGCRFSHRLDMNSTKIINCANPTAGQDVATKDYVDAYIQGLEWQELVLDKDLTDPPGGESTGDRYIVAAVAGGAWTGHEDDIAEYNGSGWDFFTPVEGWAVWVDDENILYVFDGANWIPFGGAIDHGNLLGLADDDHPQYKLGSGTDNHVVRWDGISAVQDSGVIIDNSDNVTGVTNLTASGKLVSGTLTITTSSDTTNVTGINTLFINPALAAVVIGGFLGGVNGQVLYIAIKDVNQNVTLEHEEGVGGLTQDIHLHRGVDETIDGHFGGWILVCDGTSWYDTSHARHV